MGVTRGIPSSAQGLPKTHAALAYARERHAGQRRDLDGAPFILHPTEVATLLYRAGAPDHLIAAGALHDVIEKTPTSASELRHRFGTRVCTLVQAVSEDGRIPGYAARKSDLRQKVADAGEEALMLFAADKISKARELRHRAARSRVRTRSPSGGSLRDRLSHYGKCLKLLHERIPDSPLSDQLAYELDALDADFAISAASAGPRSG
jgi:(p)ppGpp synthase/HD superfamily hydrolase